MNRLSFDICIIGAGSGGLSVAAAAARLGRKVVIVERARMGGDCLNYGCIPSKSLLATARRAHIIRSSAPFGVDAGEPRVDFPRVMACVKESIAKVALRDSVERFEKLGCKIIHGAAQFATPSTVRVGDDSISARRFVIATGSSPAGLAVPGAEEVPFLTNQTIFDLDRLPPHLIIVGGGIEGLEMAQAFRRLGSRVTVIEASDPLRREDKDLSTIVVGRLREEGVVIMDHCPVVELRRTEKGILAVLGPRHQTVEGTHVLFAVGRKPNLEDLNLAAAGIAFSQKGIEVDATMRTVNPKVYALGDVVAANMPFTHAATYQASVVVKNTLFRMPAQAHYRQIPRVTYTDPELAWVGLSAEEAETMGLGPRLLRAQFRDNDRAVTEGRTEGLVKVVLDRHSRVVGAGIVGLSAGELILPWVEMVKGRRKIRAMAEIVAPYPTLSDASRQAAVANFAAIASRTWVRRVLDMVAALG